jgi:hypothetical protein
MKWDAISPLTKFDKSSWAVINWSDETASSGTSDAAERLILLDDKTARN